MSPRKLTEDDKQDILQQYRNSQATTSTLAKSFEVSSSTISRFLKNNLSSIEYEDLIQQKRLARTPRGEKSSQKDTSSVTKSKSQTKSKTNPTKAKSKLEPPEIDIAIANNDAIPELAMSDNLKSDATTQIEPKPTPSRRRRRRSAASVGITPLALASVTPEVEVSEESKESESEEAEIVEELTPTKLVLDRKVRSKSDPEEIPKSERLILKSDRVDEDEDEDEDDEDSMDIIAIKEMLGEDLEDINDEEDDEDDWEEDDSLPYPSHRSELSDIQILPLSQASLPRTCYLVIDRSAELIVKPLAEFADLGAIPETEVKQRTLPVFDNHRIAKRFSHRRERVIKVPDGRMLQKTSHHLQDKGITRLLIDGQIYSLSN